MGSKTVGHDWSYLACMHAIRPEKLSHVTSWPTWSIRECHSCLRWVSSLWSKNGKVGAWTLEYISLPERPLLELHYKVLVSRGRGQSSCGPGIAMLLTASQIKVLGTAFLHPLCHRHLEVSCTWSTKLKWWAQPFCTRNSDLKCLVQGLCMCHHIIKWN